MTAINISEGNSTYSSVDGVVFNKAKTVLNNYPMGKEGDYVVPEGVKTLAAHSMRGTVKLGKVTLNSDLTTIEGGVFGG